MKRKITLMALILLISVSMYSGVVKKSKSEVSFQKFGTFSTVSTEQITKDKKFIESDSTFKGKGVAGLAAKAFLKSGVMNEIIDLPDMTIYQIDPKKKTFRTSPILDLSAQNESEDESGSVAVDSPQVEETQTINITHSEFRVEDTGEIKVINQFESRKFTITWITEWEDLETGQIGKDRLLTEVWATPYTPDLHASVEIEKEFNSAHMKKMGIQLDAGKEQMLGLNWMKILGSLGEGGTSSRSKASKFSKELEKIKGYPVVIDGKYYAVREGGKETTEEDTGGGARKMLGGLAKKVLSKKSDNAGEEPSFTYYSELIEVNAVQVDGSVFQVPSNFKKRGK